MFAPYFCRMRHLLRRFVPALGLLLGLLLASCTKESTLNAKQAGAWHIRRVTATYAPGTPTPGTRSVANPGDVSFLDLAGDENRVVVHADSVLPSRCLALISEDPTRRALPIGDYTYRWSNDPYGADRLVFFRNQGGLGLVAAATFTVTENKRDTQRWQYVEADAQNQITLREEWELERVK